MYTELQYSMHTYIFVCVYIYIYIYTHTHNQYKTSIMLSARVYTALWCSVCVHVRICMYIYIYIYIYIYVHTRKLCIVFLDLKLLGPSLSACLQQEAFKAIEFFSVFFSRKYYYVVSVVLTYYYVVSTRESYTYPQNTCIYIYIYMY